MRSPKTSQDHIWHNRTPISKKVIFFNFTQTRLFHYRFRISTGLHHHLLDFVYFFHAFVETAQSHQDRFSFLVQLCVKRVPWRSLERECKYEQGSFKPNGPHRNQCSLSAFRVDCWSTFADWACKIDCRGCVRSRTCAPNSHSEVETSKAGYTHTEYF